MVQPKWRFKREDGASYPDWRKDKWLNLGQFISSGTLSKADLSEEGIPCILYGELYTKYREIAHTIYSKTNSKSHIFSKKGDVILPKSGETPEDISTATCIPYDNVSLGGDLIVFRHNEKVIGRFLSYLISNRAKSAIASIAQGKSVVHISEKGLANIELTFPCLEEQKKIADFVSAVDEVIAQSEVEVQNLEQQKNAVMQKIFSQEVRFRREDGTEYSDWVETTFGTYYKIISGNAFKMNDYVKNGVPLINGESIQHGYINDNNMNYLPLHFLTDYSSCILNEGDIVLGLNRPITNGQLKIAMIPSIFNNSLLYQRAGKIVFKEPIDKYFTYVFLNKQILDFTLKEAVGSDQPFISTTKLEKWKMIMPSDKQEIKQIGIFFKEVDEAITYAKQELSKWKELKKGLLQQMFV